MADKLNGKPLKDGGKFTLLPPDDLAADRDVKAVNRIELIAVKKSKESKR